MAEADTGEADDQYLQEIAYVDSELDTTCNICNAEFLDSEDLDLHMQQVHDDNTEQASEPGSKLCQFCNSTYRDLDSYARHVADVHLASLYSCQSCTKCFTEEINHKLHEKKHRCKNSMVACSQCPAIFATQREIEVHEFMNHNNDADGQFLLCLPHLSYLLKLNALLFLQFKGKAFECHSCKMSTANIKNYMKHLKADKCNVYVCDICSTVSSDKRALIKHIHRKKQCLHPHECVSDLTTCPSCKQKVHSRDIEAHLVYCNKYKCYICNIGFQSVASLSEHQSQVHPIELDVIRCRFCHKEYVGQVSLDKHTKRSHSHQFPQYKYACKSCDNIFKHPQELFTHYFMKHKNLEPYTCKICDKKFRIRKRFTIHIKLVHKGSGFVEFDENYHVFFSENKSEQPFIPKCVIPELVAAHADEDKTSKDLGTKKPKIEDMTTDIGETEVEDDRKEVIKKRKPIVRKRKRDVVMLSSSEEEDGESLYLIKKRVERKHFQKKYSFGSRLPKKINKLHKQFTCKVCNKYCYTFQNYHNHIKIHSKNESINCVKCSKSFKTKAEMTKHVNKDHATSKLIETLKNLRERKQIQTHLNDDNAPINDENFDNLTSSEKFLRTIKKVKVDKQTVSATIKPVSGTISVKNFIENFVPEIGESAQKASEKNIEQPLVTIKQYESPYYRKCPIKLTRFTPVAPATGPLKLKMPEKFKSQPYHAANVKISMKLVNETFKPSFFVSYNSDNYETTDHHDYEVQEDNDDTRNDNIPEVAQEVMLEGTEEPPKLQAPHKIVIPKLPQGYKKIHIATLQTEAPFYKIITVKNNECSDGAIVIDPQKHKSAKEKQAAECSSKLKSDVISLPDGTKFISANPLAHLLGDKPVEDILEPIKNKRYKPAISNIKGLLAEQLQNLEKGKHKNVRKPKKNTEPGKSLPLL